MLQTLKPVLAGSICATTLLYAGAAAAVSSAELYTSESYRYGRYEARLQFAPADGVVSSFFLWKDGSELEDEYWGELDTEKVGPCAYSSNAIYGLPEKHATEKITTSADLCGEYHTYAFEWTPESIVWLLDGEEVRRLEGTVAEEFATNVVEGMQIRFNVWPGNANFGGNFSESSLPVHQFINWVAYHEYTPGAGDDGGDFTLAWREDFEEDRLPSGWFTGSWASPFSLSTHVSQNVNFVDGTAILSLTADDARGFSGTVPVDPGGSGASGGSGGTSGGSGATGGAGGTSAAPDASKDDDSGCSVRSAPPDQGPKSALLLSLAAGLAVGWYRRRRSPR